MCLRLFSHVTLFSYLWNILQMSHFNLLIFKNTLKIYKCTVNELAPVKYFKYLRQLLWSIFFKDFIFLRWTIFKWSSFKAAPQHCFCFMGCFFWPHSMWDLSYPTKDWTHSPCPGRWSSSQDSQGGKYSLKKNAKLRVESGKQGISDSIEKGHEIMLHNTFCEDGWYFKLWTYVTLIKTTSF